MGDNTTFVKITNKDIYEKMEIFERKLDVFCIKNEKAHSKIDGKSTKALITVGICMTLVIILLGVVIAHGG